MFNAVRILFQGEFNRNVLTLMTGTGLAQLIPLAITPVLARIYSPEDFGAFSLFLATALSVSVLATGRYELAIMLPRKDVDALNLAALSTVICVLVSAILLIIVWGYSEPISEELGSKAPSMWLYFVPLAVLMNGIYVNLNYWSNRNKLFYLMAHRRVMQSGGSSAVQLVLGVLRADAGGLVVGSIAGQALAAGMMANTVRRFRPGFWRSIDRRKMWALAKRYKSCPQFLAPAHMLSALSIQLPAFFMTVMFGLTTSGYFMLAERVIGMPLSLVSASFGDVFRQKMTEHYQAGKGCRQEFMSTLRKLAVIATPPFLLLLLVAPALFAVVFGERWRISGEYVQLMCLMFYMRFISDPLSLVAIVAQKNRYEFLWHASLLMSLLVAASASYFVSLDAKVYIVAFAAICIVFDFVNLFVSYKFACARDTRA